MARATTHYSTIPSFHHVFPQMFAEEVADEGIDIGVLKAAVAAAGDRVKRHRHARIVQSLAEDLTLVV